jgi:hypothetical protein
MPKLKDLIITVVHPGDPRVGIPDYRFTVTLPAHDEIMDPEYREGIRKAAEALGEAVTGDIYHAMFSDEER